MARLLHIIASPRVDRSYSRRAADAFFEAYQAAHPDDEVDTLDLWADPLPEFDNTAANGKYRILRGEEPTPEEATAWQAVVDVIDRFKAADRLVISSPMWNFGIPYKLKHYIDVIVQPTLTFNFSPDEGYSGLVTGRKALLILSRGGEYENGSDLDAQLSYLQIILGFVGISDVSSVMVQPTLMSGREVAMAKLEAATDELRKLATTF
jgi:FMN-dependent NADH-azoreductase